jgi:hypothetical protein
MFIIIFLLVVGLLIGSLCCWYYIDTFLCKEDYVTSESTVKKVAHLLNNRYPQKSVFYDLGSSRGSFALALSQVCPQLDIVGVDNSWIRILISRARAIWENKKIVFTKKDIFSVDVSEANVLYVYIPRVLLPDLARRLERDLLPHATVITSRIFFPQWKPNEVVLKDTSCPDEEDLFIYISPFIKSAN